MRIKPTMACLWLLACLLLATPVQSSETRRRRLQRCDTPDALPVTGGSSVSMADDQGLTMVALLTSTCGFCLAQARSMESLHQELQNNNSINVRMMIVNGLPGGRGVFEDIVSFDVYYDNSSRYIWRQVFNGWKDDIFLFNRCGKMLFRIPLPYSYLGYDYVSRALRVASRNTPICPCPSQDPHDVMMGDAPVTLSKVRHRPAIFSVRHRPRMSRRRPISRRRRPCSRRDSVCRALRRRFSRSVRNTDRMARRRTTRRRGKCAPGDSVCRALRGRRRNPRSVLNEGLSTE